MPNLNTIPRQDLYFYAQSFDKAAKTLVAAFQPEGTPFAEAVVFMYRHARRIAPEGAGAWRRRQLPGNQARNALSVHKTHSVSWLAQFVVQIITALSGKGS